MTEYIVVCQQVIASPGRPWTIAYNWIGEYFPTRSRAINHGFEMRGSDDFNIGVVTDNYLISFDWMNEPTGEDDETMSVIAEALGLLFDRDRVASRGAENG